MKQFMLTICAIAILANVVSGYILEGTTTEWLDLDEDDEQEELQGLKVIVPDHKLGDVATYDYTSIILMYGKNYSSEEWVRWTLTIKGQWTESILETKEVMDTFGDMRSTLSSRFTGDSKFTIVLEQNDSEPITVNGDLNIKRTEFTDLFNEKGVRADTNASLTLTGIPSLPELPIPGGSLSYSGYMGMYPDPDDDPEESLEELIYGNGKEMEVGDFGKIDKSSGAQGWNKIIYNWTVEKGMKVSGYETLLINATSDTMDWGGRNYLRTILNIANDVSFPVRSYLETNNSYDDENGTFYIFASTNKLLHPNEFTSGSSQIPWGEGSGSPFATMHNLADRKTWSDSYLPKEGDMEGTSFEFGFEEAVDYALDNSPGLNDWLDSLGNSHDRITVHDTWYNVTRDDRDKLDPDRRAGKHVWNISFVYTPTDSEEEAAIDNYYNGDGSLPDWNYRIAVANNVEKPVVGPHVENVYIDWEIVFNRTWGMLTRSEISSQLITLESSEGVIRSYPQVLSQINVDPITDKFVWENEDFYDYWILDRTDNDEWYNFQQTMVESLTGMTTPTIRIGYLLTQGSVWEAGTVFSVGIDAEDGRLVYYANAEGTPLAPLFDALDG